MILTISLAAAGAIARKKAKTKLTIVAFFIDFFIRIIVNPRYAPTLIMARWMVNNQTTEYVGAPQKRFAWAIGLSLASLMMFLVVFNDFRGPINMITCVLCLMLLFFESAFGKCVGCKLYNLFNKEKAQLCPGNGCDIKDRVAIQKLSLSQAVMALSYVGFLVALSPYLFSDLQTNRAADSTGQTLPSINEDEARCRVPEFAKNWAMRKNGSCTTVANR